MKTKLFLAASLVLILVLVVVLVSSSTTAGQSLAAPKLKPEARVTVGKREFVLRPDQVGAFAKVQVRAGALTPVRVGFPSVVANRTIVAYTLDGGALDNGQGVKRMKPDASGWVSFSFASPDVCALRRVAVKNGREVKVLHFEVIQ